MADIPGWLLGSAITLFGGAVMYLARQLWKRWRDRIVDYIDLMLRRKVNRFDRRYREFMLGSLRFIDVKGLATVGFYTPELDEVFVDVSLAYRAPHQIGESMLTKPPAEVTDRRSINEFLDHEKPVVLAIVGVPGSGKTTLLRHTTRARCRLRRGHRRTVPILLYLRDHVTKIVENPGTDLPNLVIGTLGRMGTTEPSGWFAQRLRDGDCVVLLDGLDEVARQEDRTRVATWVAEQTRQYPKNDFVITSRPQGYRSAPIDGATVVQVRSFTDDQVTRFVRDWYLAFEKHSTGEAGDDVRLRADEAAGDLLKRLDANPGLYDLTVNPLLLTMIANVHRFRGALPGSRTDLYGEICQVMLGRRQEAKNLPIELSGDKKEAILRGLAYTMMQRRVRDLPRTDIHELIRPALRRLSTRLIERDLLADLSSNGLLIEREADRFSFAHLTFQEYLAAIHIRYKDLVMTLAESVDDVWWRETTLLYATRSDPDPIVAACLDSWSVTALSLAFDIADQGSEIAPELRRRLKIWLDSTSDDPARRRLRTGVLVTRHLRDQIRTGSGGRVCARPISTMIYELFRESTGVPTPDGPDHRRNEPITGVQRRDAAAFVRWINDYVGSETAYRLPTRAEISDPATQRALSATPGLSVWLEPENKTNQPELWLPPDSDHPNRIDAELLAYYVNSDLRRSAETVARLHLLYAFVAVYTFDLDLSTHLSRDFSRALTLALDLNPYLYFARELPIDTTLEVKVDRALALEVDRTLARDLDRARACILDVALDLEHDLAFDLDRTRIGASVLGRALASALAHSLQGAPIALDRTRNFVRAFVDETRIAGGTWIVSLNTLANSVREGRERFQSLSSPDPSTWAVEVASRLEKMALPIFIRREPLSADIATAIRIAALCLAAEADERGNQRIGDTYRQVAAGVTLMERRATGEAPVTETIMLAIA